jgi:hypothetical protein
MLVVAADVDDNRVSPENAEIEARLRFEQDLIGGERLENRKLDGHLTVSERIEERVDDEGTAQPDWKQKNKTK